ncbi:MAG: PRC-barrel domain-containing protein [Pseudomonadota bacterium]|jgi:sporulation protein YlmC with PRC-barrel domain|nr:PRC-barrel domain-containing protein [Alphaproteobacteria bacterium]MEC7703477.1 PRC-barrel domain-containing protein [Pseudomonadota bacterium]
MQRKKHQGFGILNLVIYGIIAFVGYQVFTSFRDSNDGSDGAKLAATAPSAGSHIIHNINKHYETKVASIPDDGVARSYDDFTSLDVFNNEKKYIGKIQEIYIDTETGAAQYISVLKEADAFRDDSDTELIYPISSFAALNPRGMAKIKENAAVVDPEKSKHIGFALSNIIGVDVVNQNDEFIGVLHNVSIDRDFNIGHYIIEVPLIESKGVEWITISFKDSLIIPQKVGYAVQTGRNINPRAM